MKFLVIFLLLSVAAFAQSDCKEQDDKSANGLVAVENRWVAALDGRNQKALGCILAPEFKDSGVNGELRDRSTVLAALPNRKGGDNQHLDELERLVLDDVGVVRGVNHLTTPDGRPFADVRFTDVFSYRDGRWQAVSAQETLVRKSEEKHSSWTSKSLPKN